MSASRREANFHSWRLRAFQIKGGAIMGGLGRGRLRALGVEQLAADIALLGKEVVTRQVLPRARGRRRAARARLHRRGIQDCQDLTTA